MKAALKWAAWGVAALIAYLILDSRPEGERGIIWLFFVGAWCFYTLGKQADTDRAKHAEAIRLLHERIDRLEGRHDESDF